LNETLGRKRCGFQTAATEDFVAVVDVAALAKPWASAEFTFDLDGDRIRQPLKRTGLTGQREKSSHIDAPTGGR
jgi:hypothetical protein